MARRRRKENNENLICIGDKVRINYKLSPFYGVETEVLEILGNRCRPVYVCKIKGKKINVSRAFLEKMDTKEKKGEKIEELEKKDENNGDN